MNRTLVLIFVCFLILIAGTYIVATDLWFLCQRQLDRLYVYYTLLIILIALFAGAIWNWYHSPKILLVFKPEIPWIKKTNGRIWVRIKVTNTGGDTAKQCIPRLEKIFDVSNSDQEIVERTEKLFLPWVGYPLAFYIYDDTHSASGYIGPTKRRRLKRDSHYLVQAKEWMSMDIPKGMDALFDLCFIDKRNQKINLVTSIKWPIDVKWVRDEKKLKFLVTVYGNNFKPKSPPKDIVIDVDSILKQVN